MREKRLAPSRGVLGLLTEETLHPATSRPVCSRPTCSVALLESDGDMAATCSHHCEHRMLKGLLQKVMLQIGPHTAG